MRSAAVVTVVVAMLVLVSPTVAKAECEAEVQDAISRFLTKRGLKVTAFASLVVRRSTDANRSQQYEVTTTVVTSDKTMLNFHFTMSSPFATCEDLSIESVL